MSPSTSDLGHVLRGWRNRLSPVDAGLPESSRRRAPGLRREEVAQLAGLSVDYLIRLEQGRARHPSAQVVASLARSLQLDRTHRDHLYRLAGLLPPTDGLIDTHVSPGVARLVARLVDAPVGVFSAHWQLLTWNPMWAALHGDPTALEPLQRNLIHAVFGSEDTARRLFRPVTSTNGVERFAAALVADLRTAATSYPSDPSLLSLVEKLCRDNDYFKALWMSRTAAVHETDRKTIHHPGVDTITLDCDVLTAPGSDVHVVIYTAASGSPDAQKLEHLRAASGTFR